MNNNIIRYAPKSCVPYMEQLQKDGVVFKLHPYSFSFETMSLQREGGTIYIPSSGNWPPALFELALRHEHGHLIVHNRGEGIKTRNPSSLEILENEVAAWHACHFLKPFTSYHRKFAARFFSGYVEDHDPHSLSYWLSRLP